MIQGHEPVKLEDLLIAVNSVQEEIDGLDYAGLIRLFQEYGFYDAKGTPLHEHPHFKALAARAVMHADTYSIANSMNMLSETGVALAAAMAVILKHQECEIPDKLKTMLNCCLTYFEAFFTSPSQNRRIDDFVRMIFPVTGS